MSTISEYVTMYVNERQGLGHICDTTAAGALAVLGQMARNLPERPEEVTVGHLRTWLVSTDRDTPVAQRTVALRTVRARHFFEWLVDMEVLAQSPARKLEAPKVRSGEPRFFEVDEVRRLCEVARTPRDLAMVLVMVQMGLRRVEVHRALVSDLRLDDATMGLRGKGYRGEVSRRVPIPAEAHGALSAWMRFRPRVGDVLFCTNKGTPLQLTWISRKCSDMMREAGIKQRSGDGKSAHALRHTFAQHLVDGDVPLRVVQQALGHASVTTTEQYARRTVEVLAEALEGRSYAGDAA